MKTASHSPALFFLTPYNFDARAHSDLHSSDPGSEPSLTVQSQAEEADINTIVRNFGLTGRLPTNVRVPTYADFENAGDFFEAQLALKSAEDSFMSMPAHVRAEFQNSPQQFLEFCEALTPEGTLANLDEMRKLGLAVPLPPAPKEEPPPKP